MSWLFRKDASTGSGLFKAYEKSLKDAEAPVEPVKNADVAVFSLLPGRGTTHTAAAIANYLSDDEDNRMAFFTKELFENPKSKAEYLRGNIDAFSTNEKADTARKYTSVVEDAGVIENYSELPSAKTLICVCTGDTKYLHQLAKFVTNARNADDVFYVFNMTDKTKIPEIRRLMDCHRFAGCITEVYPAQYPPRSVKLLYRNILVTDIES